MEIAKFGESMLCRKMRLPFVAMLVLVLVLVSSLVSLTVTAASDAADFTVTINPIIKNFYPTQQGKYEVSIINKQATDDEFSLSFTNTPKWSVETEPLSYLSGVNVKTNQNVTFIVYITPVPDYQFGPHDFNILVSSKNTGFTAVEVLPVLLRNPSKDFIEYAPVINLDVDIPEKIDPKEKYTIKVYLNNRNKLDIKNLTISVASTYFSAEKRTTLAPLEKKTELITLEYDPLLKPTDDLVVVTVVANGVEFKPPAKEIEIIGYSTIKETMQKEDKFLKYTRSVTYTNNGNIANKKKLVVATSFFEQLFSSTTPEAQKTIENGIREFVWEIELQPEESKTITLVINYRTVFIILLILVLLIAAYYSFRSPMTITKEYRVIKSAKTKDEEGISHLKVLIHIKNRTNKVVEHVKIIDRVPNIAELDKEYSVGTLHPEKVLYHELKGTLIKWDLPVVEPYEERIISYTIRSKLRILGTVTLPPASLKYKNQRGNEVKISSNKFTAGADEE